MTTNTNFLSPIGFQFGISKLPDIGFYTQQANLPGIILPETQQATPFTDGYQPGEKLNWDTLSINFIIDSNMDNYHAVWKWLVALGFPNNYEEFADYNGRNPFQFSDGFLQILTGDNNIAKTLYFKDLFPTSLSAITFSSMENDVNYLQATADFRYTSFTIE